MALWLPQRMSTPTSAIGVRDFHELTEIRYAEMVSHENFLIAGFHWTEELG
jgi:hypothetical protein